MLNPAVQNAPPDLTHSAEQALIGKLLMHQPKRLKLMDWWQDVNAHLQQADAAEATWGDVAWRYRERTSMTPEQCAAAVMAERAAGA